MFSCNPAIIPAQTRRCGETWVLPVRRLNVGCAPQATSERVDQSERGVHVRLDAASNKGASEIRGAGRGFSVDRISPINPGWACSTNV
eukprot:2822013-Rhodomonas_salina.2